MATVWGALTVVVAGLVQGSGAWPMKLMTKFKFEHWWFIAMLVGLVLAPWFITVSLCPHAWEAYRSIDTATLLKANFFAFSWGVANILCGLCFVRIGIALTGGILTGLGVSIGVTLPMIVKGSGLFREAPSVTSPAGSGLWTRSHTKMYQPIAVGELSGRPRYGGSGGHIVRGYQLCVRLQPGADCLGNEGARRQ